MTERKFKAVCPRLEALVAQDRELLKALVKEALDQGLPLRPAAAAEMSEFLGAGPGERIATRAGYRAGYYERGLVTRVGKSNCGCRATARGSFPRRCSSGFGVARRRLCRRWWRNACKGCVRRHRNLTPGGADEFLDG